MSLAPPTSCAAHLLMHVPRGMYGREVDKAVERIDKASRCSESNEGLESISDQFMSPAHPKHTWLADIPPFSNPQFHTHPAGLPPTQQHKNHPTMQYIVNCNHETPKPQNPKTPVASTYEKKIIKFKINVCGGCCCCWLMPLQISISVTCRTVWNQCSNICWQLCSKQVFSRSFWGCVDLNYS